jgi:hypothetical protein
MKTKILSISDLHLGHPRVPSLLVHDKLLKHFIPYVKKADIVFLAGDLYHTLLHLSGQEARIGMSFILILMKECEKYNTTLRVLRGTYTHDRDQSKMIHTLHKESGIQVNLQYYDSVSLEYIEHLDLKVLYLPDDLPYDSSKDVLIYVKELLTQVGWNKLDLVCGHGYFSHVLPPNIPHEPKITYKVEQFKDILADDGLILMGHVHTKSQYGQVLYNGSFDRLAHNEEEDKGFFYIDNSIKFIKNTDATLFKSIDLSHMPIEDKDKIIDTFISIVDNINNPNQLGYVRFIYPDIEIRQIVDKVVSDKYPNLKFSSKSSKAKPGLSLSENDLDVNYCDDIDISEKNLPSLIYGFLNGQSTCPLAISEISDLLDSL